MMMIDRSSLAASLCGKPSSVVQQISPCTSVTEGRSEWMQCDRRFGNIDVIIVGGCATMVIVSAVSGKLSLVVHASSKEPTEEQTDST